MGKRVLLADDSATIQKLVKMALSGTTYELFSAFDGREALGLLKEAAPDIVLADAIMPDMDGYDLCSAIKDMSEYQFVPVVLLIGRFQPFDERRAEAAGIDERMIKPFSSERLIELIEKLLKEAKGRQVPQLEEGEMDETVNMSPEELAAHTSHWQAEQTALTEDIPKIEDIEFDEDVQFDESQATGDLKEADTMLLEEELAEPLDEAEEADTGGPMTMELATEDLADIEDPVGDLEPLDAFSSGEDALVDDDLEELDESDLLDDSVADMDATVAFSGTPEFSHSSKAIEDLDTGPLSPVAQSKPAPVEDDEEGDTQPVEPPDYLPEQNTASLDEPLLDSGTQSLTFSQVDPEKVFEDDTAPSQPPIVPEPLVSEHDLRASRPHEDSDLSFSGEEVLPEVEAPADFEEISEPEFDTAENLEYEPVSSFSDEEALPQASFDSASFEEPAEPIPDYEDSPAETVTPPVDFAPEAPLDSPPPISKYAHLFSDNESLPTIASEPESETEMPLEVDEESPLEESPTDQDAVLEDVDFEPLAADVEEPLAEALLSEESTSEIYDQDDDFLASEVGEPEVEVAMISPDDEEGMLSGETGGEGAVEVDQSAFTAPSEPEPDPLPAPEVAPETLEPEPLPMATFSEPEPIESAPEPAPEESVSEPEPEPVAASAADTAPMQTISETVAGLSEVQLDQLADKVAERVMRKFERESIREIAWEVIPELSEAIIKRRIYELEQAVDQD